MTDVYNKNILLGKIGEGIKLSYYEVPKISIENNITYNSIIKQTSLNWKEVRSGDIINSKLFYMTHKIIDNEPLFYRYILKYPVLDDNIHFVINDNSNVPSKFKILKDIFYNDALYITLYTNFYMENIYVIYNAIIDNKTILGYKEHINSIPFSKQSDILSNDDEYKLNENSLGNYLIEFINENIHYILPLDIDNIYLKNPITINNNWYIRIKNGYMVKNKYIYMNNDYYNQEFNNDGYPYIDILEVPKIIGSKQLQLNNKPYNINSININGNNTDVISINENIISVSNILNKYDIIEVNYTYIEDSLIYKGYNIEDNNGNSIFVPLDLNPLSGTYGYIDNDNKLILNKSFNLLNKTIYLYIKPTIEQVIIKNIQQDEINLDNVLNVLYIDVPLSKNIKKGNTYVYTKYSNLNIPLKINDNLEYAWDYIEDYKDRIRIWNPAYFSGEPVIIRYEYESENIIKENINLNNRIFHSIYEIPTSDDLLLIGKIYIRPNSNKEDVKLIDIRERGGGLIDIKPNIRKLIAPESNNFLDINDIHGELLQENACIIIKVNKNLLKENGGQFTKQQIEEAINKHKAYGTLSIIKYVDDEYHVKIV